MFKYKGILILIFSLVSAVSPCQDKVLQPVRIQFRGLVADAVDQKPLAGAGISVNNNLNAISGNDGTFSFHAFIRDTIIVSALGYKPAKIIVSDTLRGSEFIAGVFLKADTLAIEEVIIIPRFINLKSEILNSPIKSPAAFENARFNVAVSAYQGRTSQGSLGDPSDNYRMLAGRQKTEAFEKGGIPSDKIAGISPLLLIPATYLLFNGLPPKPASINRQISDQELDELNKAYLEMLERRVRKLP